ncbi:hypothetical protein BDV95DRAFT_251797 [Massariosphaeria phaeospora]|uniref:Uncharacterized protein n=1 Tax=Massariosphaeria phaeospora TaxID=100035 RepID=A0A7C8I6H0_9PLEO|nr:hypothetical protein BDV95DRAFT_251797 [Massariosphaeria phaeospora]
MNDSPRHRPTMTSVLDGVRDYAQTHPMSVTAVVVIALPGTYLYLTGQDMACAFGLCSDAYTSVCPRVPGNATTTTLSRCSSNALSARLGLPICQWTESPAPVFVVRTVLGARQDVIAFLNSTSERWGVMVHPAVTFLRDRWATQLPLSRFTAVALATALPGAFLSFLRRHPQSWAAAHHAQIAHALHLLALVTVVNQTISVEHLVAAALVMVAFEALRTTRAVAAMEDVAAVGTDVALSSTAQRSKANGKSGDAISANGHTDVPNTASRDLDLLRTRQDLQTASDALRETLAECSQLREQMKTAKHTLGRDHQAIVYRKDIELFAMRKANDQKETHIKDRDVRFDDICRQHTTALELRDAQLRGLKERIVLLERQHSPRPDKQTPAEMNANGDQCAALQVKLLRVKGRNSLEIEATTDEKDAEIAKLREELTKAIEASEALVKTQDEARRAWDATFGLQNDLNDERRLHAQTREKLHAAAIKLDEEVKRNTQRGSPTRLPTIQEQDKKELEAMFNAVQQDNLRLYADHEALDKRLREANARIFSSDQELDTLKEQLRLEKAINEDMEAAQPSTVHGVHFQRMEGELKESRHALETNATEILFLQERIAAKDSEIESFQKDKEDTEMTRNQLREENERLKNTVTDLESTKTQLLADHERLARHRARRSTASADRVSARSSSATLITEPTQVLANSDEPMPDRPGTAITENSVQRTPERHLRRDAEHSLETQERIDSNRTAEPLQQNDADRAPELQERNDVDRTPETPQRSNAGRSAEVPPLYDAEHTPETQQRVSVDRTPMQQRINGDHRPQTQQRNDANPISLITNNVPPPELRSPRRKSLTLKNLMRKIVRRDPDPEPKPSKPSQSTTTTNSRPALALKDHNATPRPKTAALPNKGPATGASSTGARPTTSAAPPLQRQVANKENARPLSARYYSKPEGFAARPHTPAATLATMAQDDGAGSGSARPKSRGWANSRKLVRKSIA